MPELSNIQTYEKLVGTDYRPVLSRFVRVLKNLGLWNDEIKQSFDKFDFSIQDSGFGYASATGPEDSVTKYSEIPVRPLIMAYSPSIDTSFTDNWVICELLIKTDHLRDSSSTQFGAHAYPLIRTLVYELAKEFPATGAYFTNENQDGQLFDSIRRGKRKDLWEFDYGLIPNSLEFKYPAPPVTHAINRVSHFIESWHMDHWQHNDTLHLV